MESGTRHSPLGGIAVVLLAAVCISLSNVLTPVVYRTGTTVSALLVARFFVFPCLCLAWLKLQRSPMHMTGRERVISFVAGLFYMTGHGCLIGSFALLPVSLAILIFFTFPLVTLLMECLLDRRLPELLRIACIVVALAGLTIALRVDLAALTAEGIALAATAAVCVATAFVCTGRTLAHVDSTLMTFHMALSGLVLAVLYAAFTGRFSLHISDPLEATSFAAAVLAFNAAFLAMYVGVRKIGASRAAMLMNMEPVFTIALAVMVLGENLSAAQTFGAATVIAAVVTAQRQNPS